MTKVSIWVDQVYGTLLLGPMRFIRSICPDEFPNQESRTFIKWSQPRNVHSQKSRFKDDGMPLTCCKVQHSQRSFHLFYLGEAAWGAFHEDHMLTELDFQPKVAGIVVVIEKRNIERQYQWFEDKERGKKLPEDIRTLSERLGYLSENNDSPLSTGLWYFSWVRNHRLPFVIAASGYQSSQSALEKLRKNLGLNSNIPMIPGPSLHQENDDIWAFDAEHAKRVLSALNEHIQV